MSRMYVVPFVSVTISAAQDAFELRPATDKPITIHKVVITPDSSETNQQILVRIKRLPATVTSGTGGTTPTPVPLNSHDAAAAFTAEVNNTGRATTSGTALDLNPESFPSQGGFEYLPDVPARPVFFAGEACIVGIEEAPAVACSGFALVEEM